MAFVLDASITACWAFDEEDHPDAGFAFDRTRAEEGVVPSLWWFEVPKYSDRERTAASDYRIRYRLFSAEPFAAATAHRPVSRRKRDPPAGAQSDVVRLRCRVSWNWPSGRDYRWQPRTPTCAGQRPAKGWPWFPAAMPRIPSPRGSSRG